MAFLQYEKVGSSLIWVYTFHPSDTEYWGVFSKCFFFLTVNMVLEFTVYNLHADKYSTAPMNFLQLTSELTICHHNLFSRDDVSNKRMRVCYCNRHVWTMEMDRSILIAPHSSCWSDKQQHLTSDSLGLLVFIRGCKKLKKMNKQQYKMYLFEKWSEWHGKTIERGCCSTVKAIKNIIYRSWMRFSSFLRVLVSLRLSGSISWLEGESCSAWNSKPWRIYGGIWLLNICVLVLQTVTLLAKEGYWTSMHEHEQ